MENLAPFGCAQGKPFPPFPLEEQVQTFFSEMRERRLEEPTGLIREFYLDLAEPIARAGAAWVDEEGRVIDPYRKEETATTTARFVAAISILIGAGRVGYFKKRGRTIRYGLRLSSVE